MYRLIENGFIQREADSVVFPADSGNTDYLEYLKWLGEGNTPSPAVVVPPAVPATVTRFQARAALMRSGLLDTVNSLMDAPGADPFMKLAWEYAQEFKRDSPTVLALAASLGLSETTIDDLFRLAATVEA